MNLLDTVVVVISLAALLLGFRKGIINQIGDIAAIVLGMAACRLMPQRADQLSHLIASDHVDNPATGWVCHAVGYILLFLLVYFAVKIVARLMRTVTHAAMLGPVDRVAGAIFMAAKCLLALSIVLNIWIFLKPDSSLTQGCDQRLQPLEQKVIAFAPWLLGALSDHAGDCAPQQQPPTQQHDTGR